MKRRPVKERLELMSSAIEQAAEALRNCHEIFTRSPAMRAEFGSLAREITATLVRLTAERAAEDRMIEEYDAANRREEEAIERAAALRSPADGWRTIKSAPKDRRILLGKIVGHPAHPTALWWAVLGNWSTQWNNWSDGIEPSGLADPTHWAEPPAIPLPSPPAEEKTP